MRAHHESFLSPEQEYEAAGWVCVAETLKDLAEQRKQGELSKTTERWIGAHAFLLGQTYSDDPSKLVPKLQRQTESDSRHIPAVLTTSRMMRSDKTINPHLQLAHTLHFSRDATPKSKLSRSNFERLEPHIITMREYNRAVLARVCARSYDYSIGDALNEVRRESAFFVGYYDNED